MNACMCLLQVWVLEVLQAALAGSPRYRTVVCGYPPCVPAVARGTHRVNCGRGPALAMHLRALLCGPAVLQYWSITANQLHQSVSNLELGK